jgi:adenosylcobinamide-phosphate synthase
MEGALIMMLAVALDVLLGEPPSRLHPVVWIGRVVGVLERGAPSRGVGGQLAYGCAMVVLSVGATFALVWCALRYAGMGGTVAYMCAGALLLKPALSLKALRQAALDVEDALDQGKLECARIRLRSLVSRDTSKLDQAGAASATLESVAENVSDSFVAPLFYFLFLGVPGAATYRTVNTLDAIVGYHGRYEYLGKCAARLDDVLNFLPARISGVLLVAGAYFSRLRGRGAWRTMLRDHNTTESPNAGWPMSAMAGALGVRLEKAGFYRLGAEEIDPVPRRIRTGVRLALRSSVLWLLICLAVEVTWSGLSP